MQILVSKLSFFAHKHICTHSHMQTYRDTRFLITIIINIGMIGASVPSRVAISNVF